jgi:transposase
MAREKRETWIKRIERWRESGLTAKEFAAEIGVNAATLMHWRYRLAAETRGAAPGTVGPKQEAVSFVEVKAAPAEIGPPDRAQSAFEVVLASGAIVRVPPHFDAATLRRLLDVMAPR